MVNALTLDFGSLCGISIQSKTYYHMVGYFVNLPYILFIPRGNMADLRGTVQGNRSEASRLGHKSSGLETSCNTWTHGVTCKAYFDETLDDYIIAVYATGGSGYSGRYQLVATVQKEE